jgi:serine/threonine protein kinase
VSAGFCFENDVVNISSTQFTYSRYREIMHQTLQRGYTKSIDLWSVGCIAVTLLIGCPPFPLSPSGASDDRAIRPGDMRYMLGSPRWHRVEPFAQNFVYNLLALDETERLTTTEALQHIWLTSFTVRQKLDELYANAIRSWTPCVAQRPMVLNFNTVEEIAETIHTDQVCHGKAQKNVVEEGFLPLTGQSGRSRSLDSLLVPVGFRKSYRSYAPEYSNAVEREVNDLDQGREASPTLSDPDFPVYSTDEKSHIATVEHNERDENTNVAMEIACTSPNVASNTASVTSFQSPSVDGGENREVLDPSCDKVPTAFRDREVDLAKIDLK